MVLRSFGQWLFLSFIVLSVVTLSVFGLAAAWWGPSGLKAWGTGFLEYYSANEHAFDVGFRATGLMFTVLTGLFGLYKALHFAEKRLPYRLHDYIENIKNIEIVKDREEVLAQIATAPSQVVQKLESRKPEIDRVRRLLNKAKESWDYEQATQHYAYGQLNVKQAEEQAEDSFAHRTATKLREEAIQHYKQAALLDPSDLRALECAAKEAEHLKHYEQAVELWERLAQAQHLRGADFLQAQALFFAAQGYWERSKDPGFMRGVQNEFQRSARDHAESAIDLLQSRSDPQWLELSARCFELVGVVRTKLRTPKAAETALKEAVLLYQNLGRPHDVKRVQERIAQILREEPASDDECDRTDFAIGRAYEALGLAHLERDDISGARSKAERNLRLALAVYEQIDPRPEEAIARVEEKLRDPWLQ